MTDQSQLALKEIAEGGEINMRAIDLRDVTTVVVDEADQMADMGFLPAVRRIVEQTSVDRQVLLFSATLEGPVKKLVDDFQRAEDTDNLTIPA